MAIAGFSESLHLIPVMSRASRNSAWMIYDSMVDTLHVNFKKPGCATDSEMTGDDVIIRYKNNEVIGLTVLHASKRLKKTA